MNKLTSRSLFLVTAFMLSACDRPVETPAVEEPTTRATPFLLFQGGKAEEAMNFYTSLFEDGEILSIERYGPEGPGAEGTVYEAEFRVGGQLVRATDSPIRHDWDFTPGWSFWVDSRSEKEVEELVQALSQGGMTMMPLGDYGWSQQFAFVQDRFGISWQINLPFE